MSRTPHPFFRGPISWHSKLEDALNEARQSHRIVLLAHCQAKCEGSRALVEKVLCKEELAEMIEKNFVPLASDSDHPDPEIAAILATLPKTAPTPVCVYLNSDGQVLKSTAGGRHPAVLLNDLQQA